MTYDYKIFIKKTSIEENMKPLNILLLFVYYSIFAFTIMSENASANDDLYLCGVVKKVNTQEKNVLVHVTSEGCTGDKIFDVSQALQLDQFVVGENKCFKIDTNICPQNQVATILGE